GYLPQNLPREIALGDTKGLVLGDQDAIAGQQLKIDGIIQVFDLPLRLPVAVERDQAVRAVSGIHRHRLRKDLLSPLAALLKHPARTLAALLKQHPRTLAAARVWPKSPPPRTTAPGETARTPTARQTAARTTGQTAGATKTTSAGANHARPGSIRTEFCNHDQTRGRRSFLQPG